MSEVVIYTTPFCGYCTSAKRLLGQKSVKYVEIDVSKGYETRRWLAQASGQRTVPQVFINGQPYGGYTDLVALDRQGRLDPLLKAATPIEAV